MIDEQDQRQADLGWQTLLQAYQSLHRGQIHTAVGHYKAVIAQRTLMNVPLPLWTHSPEKPSRAWLCIYLADYYALSGSWYGWRELAKPFIEASVQAKLPLPIRWRMQVAFAWADFRQPGVQLHHIIALHKTALRNSTQESTDTEPAEMAACQAAHNLVLCHAYTLAFRDTAALTCGNQALEHDRHYDDPYLLVRALEIVGTMHYTQRKRYLAAHTCYDEADSVAQMCGDEGTGLRLHYARGWAYLGEGKHDMALLCFRRSAKQKQVLALSYEVARSRYAEAYALFRLGNLDEAKACVDNALRIVTDSNHPMQAMHFGSFLYSAPMIAACSHIRAQIARYKGMAAHGDERRTQYSAALEDAHRALVYQKQLNDPGQMHDMLLHAGWLALHLGRPREFMGNFIEFILLKFRYNVPGL